MEENLRKVFKQSKIEPESQLPNNIWNVIQSKNSIISKWKTLEYLSLGILSLFGSIFSIRSLIEQFRALGFFDYLSLIYSDVGVIATYWREYVLILADSLPTTSLMISLLLLFLLFNSLRHISYLFNRKLRIA